MRHFVGTRRYAGRVIAFVGAREGKLGRRTQRVATVRARWPSTPDFEKGEFVDVEEEEEVELWESNFGCANMRDQWVVYPGQLPGDGDGGGTGASSANAIDLTMHDARVQADALCAPASMF